jgi:hypothetical protein
MGKAGAVPTVGWPTAFRSGHPRTALSKLDGGQPGALEAVRKLLTDSPGDIVQNFG